MVYVHLAEGFEEIEAVTILDVLRRGGIQAFFVSMGKEKLVRGTHGILIEADITFETADYASCEMIALPGGMPGTKHLAENEELLTKIKEFYKQGKYLAAVCAAPMVFAEANILNGKNATIYPGMEDYLKGAKLSTNKVVVDGNIITSRGPGTSIEFALTIVETLMGQTVSDKLRKALVI
ncbi:MAG: DJ-1/PfpI family protein [Peptostreptococcaceae bacterium]|nr:DJ-1/PfpI family protein [Peptostreptococcaceae bacterium]